MNKNNIVSGHSFRSSDTFLNFFKKIAVLGTAVSLVVGGFFIPQQTFAVHTATVTVSPTLVKGGSSGTYSFNVTNNGPDGIYRAIVAIPSGFTSIASASCPTGMTASEVSSTQVICLGDPFDAGTLIASGVSAQVSFNATSPTPGSDTMYTWSVTTRDTTGTSVSNTSAQTNVDATAPTITSIATKDTDSDGKVDTATIVFSEAVLDSSFGTGGNFTIGGSVGTSISTGTADDATFDVLVSGGVVGTEAKDVLYTQGTGSDTVGNLLASVVTGTVVEIDGAAPVLMSARTQSPTTIYLTFSEDLLGTTITNADFSVTGFTLTTPDATDTDTPGIVQLTVSTPFGTGDTPHVSYIGDVKDLPNLNTAPVRSDVTATDGIAPIIASTRTVTTTTIEVTFTEAMSAVLAGDFTVAGNTVSSVTLTSGTTATLTLGTPIGTGATPAVGTIATPTGTADNASTPNTITGSLTSTPVDGIAPTITSTAPATSTFIKAEKVSYTLSEAALSAVGSIVFTRTSGTADSNVHTCSLQGTALASGAHTDLTLINDANVCSGWTALVDGAIYTATFNVSDIAGNPATAVMNTDVTYDITVPTLTSVTIASSNSNPTLAKVGDTITLTVVASENLTSTPTVTITGDAVTPTGSGVNWTATYIMAGGDTEGVVPFTINFTDIATNPGAPVAAITGGSDVTFDKTAPGTPTVGIFTATGGTAVAAYINSTNTGFALTFTSPATNFDGVAHLYVGGVEFATPIMFSVVDGNAGYTLTGDATSIAGLGTDGVKALTVVIIDAAGNISSASSASSITKDTGVPTAVFSAATDDVGSVTGPITSGQTTNDTVLVLSGTNEAGSTVEVFNGGTSLGQATITTTTWSFTATVADGITYQFNAKETDIAGNISSATSNFTVIGDTSAPNAPVITSIATDNKINDSEKGAVHVIGTAEANSTVSVTLTGVAVAGPITGTANGSGAFDITLDTTSLTDGTVTPSVTATDAAGNVSVAATTPTATKDVVAPTATQVTPVTTPKNDTTPDVVINVESGATWQIKNSEETVLASGTGTGASQTATLSVLSAGTYSLNLVATDTDGNTTTTALTAFTIDTTNPTISISSPVADSVTKGTSITLGSSASDDSGVTCQYKVDSGSLATIACTGEAINGLTDGRRVITLVATDGATNTSTTQVSIVVDTDNTLTVGASGADFTTIQAAVTAATANDTLAIATGTYDEAVTIAKSLVLTGTGSPTATSFTLTSGAVLTGSTGITASTINVNSGAKIQDGVLLASSGGTVNVGAGTYAENVSITSKSSITIQGVGVTTVVEPATGIGFAITDSDGVTIKNLKIHTAGTDAHGIWVAGTPNSGGATVTGLTVQDTTIVVDGFSAGIYAERVDTAPHSGWLIGGLGHGNSITINTGTGGTGDGMDLHDVSASTVSYNTITLNNPVSSTNVLWTSELSNLTNLVFSNNTVSGSSGSEIAFVPNFILTGNSSTITTVTVSGNTFSNWGSRALRIGSGATSVTVSGNKFLVALVAEILKNEDNVASINAEGNWWGQSTGPATGAVVEDTGTVDYRPWYLSEADLDNSVLDSTAPTVALTYSANLAGVGSMTITATYSEAVADTPQISVNQQGTMDVSNAAMSGSGAVWTYHYTVNVADGSAYVDGVATVSLSSVNDSSGNIAGSPTGTTFTIDTVAPTATLTGAPTGTTNMITADITVAGTDVTHYKYKLDSGAYGEETPVVTHITLSGLTDGSRTVSVIGRDVAGNYQSVDTTATWTIDSTPPATPSITSIAGDNYINNAEKGAVHVVGTAEADSTVNVSLTSGVTVTGSGTATGGNFDITIVGTTLIDGTVTTSVTATDAAGNVSTAVTTPTATKDITAPTVTSKTPSASAVGIDPTTNITVVFSENIVITSGTVELGNGTATTTTTVTGSGTDTATINPDTTLDNNSTYTIILTGVTDTVGNTLPTTSWVFTTSASYSMTLTTGWNLISLPVVPNDTQASAVLGSLNDETKIETVWKYDPIAGTWGAYHPNGSGTSNFSTMTAGEGYWINYLASASGTIAGTGNLFQAGNSTPPQKSLAAGWNLIGYYQLENVTNITATHALSTVTGQWTQLRTYNNTGKQFQAVIGSDTMKPGEGYWIFMKSSSYAPYLYGPGDTD